MSVPDSPVISFNPAKHRNDTRMDPSALPVKIMPASLSHATVHTASECAGKTLKMFPVLTSHNIALSSKDPLTRQSDLGEKAVHSTGAVCPSNRLKDGIRDVALVGAFKAWIFIHLSSDAVAM